MMTRVAKADPGNAGWQRDLAVTYSAVGDVLKVQGMPRAGFRARAGWSVSLVNGDGMSFSD
jgi:hypothetical protein